jgi:hypothetical protein
MAHSCWIIEQGEYSDYRVVGIFSTKENAERILAFIRDPENEWSEPLIREKVLDPGIDELNEGLRCFSVSFRYADNSVTVNELKNFTDDGFHWKGGGVYNVWAHDAEHATKIAAEQHAQWLASLPTKETRRDVPEAR